MKKTLILLLFFVFQNVNGQVEKASNQTSGKKGLSGVELKEEVSEYYIIGGKKFYLFSYEIVNNSDETTYFWLNKEDLSNLSDSAIINNYFKKRRGEWNLYQLGLDINVDTFTPILFITFLKKILPGKIFAIQIIIKNKNSDTTKVQKYVDRHAVLYKQTKMSQYVPGINNFTSVVLFEQDLLILDQEDLIK